YFSKSLDFTGVEAVVDDVFISLFSGQEKDNLRTASSADELLSFSRMSVVSSSSGHIISLMVEDEIGTTGLIESHNPIPSPGPLTRPVPKPRTKITKPQSGSFESSESSLSQNELNQRVEPPR